MSEQTTLTDFWGNVAMTISVKGVVIEGEKVWLRKNERNEWELPGGRLEDGEQPEATIVREIKEELGMEVALPQLLDFYVWKKEFGTSSHVAIVTYLCTHRASSGIFELEGEAGPAEFQGFALDEALELKNLPFVYKRAIEKLRL